MRKTMLLAGVFLALSLSAAGVNAQILKEQDEGERVQAFLKEVNPSLSAQVKLLMTMNQREAQRIMAGVTDQFRELERLRLNNSALADKLYQTIKLEAKINDLGREMRQNPDSQKKAGQTEEIKGMLSQAFDNKLELEDARAKEIENQVKQIRDKIAQRKQNKAKIIEQRLQDITTDEYLRW